MTTKFAALISRSHGSMIKTVACVQSVTFQFTLIGQHKESGMMMMITFRDKTTMMMITLLIMSSALPPYPKPKLILLALIFPFPLMIFFFLPNFDFESHFDFHYIELLLSFLSFVAYPLFIAWAGEYYLRVDGGGHALGYASKSCWRWQVYSSPWSKGRLEIFWVARKPFLTDTTTTTTFYVSFIFYLFRASL